MRQVCLVLLMLSAAGSSLTTAAPASQCQATLPPASKDPNIFTQAQENDLGDAVAERFETSLRIIEDDALTSTLSRIGAKLVANLPPSDFRLRLHLVDIPDANAFALPGGRVYVSRKLIGLTRSEDELAGIVGHELGHLVARQQTIAATKQMREILGVTSIGDRKDLLEKYNRLLDNAGRKPGLFKSESHGQGDQLEADRLGLYLVAAAGYDPRANAEFYDRYAGTEGDTGGFFSRLFGTTNPDSKRLGELLKTLGALPAGCMGQAAPSADAYHQWQMAVATATVTSREERLPGLIRQAPLTPFRDRVRHVRFSPDGRHVLVQDDGSISVIDRQPFALRFRIPARHAKQAVFAPDSGSVVFHTTDLRIERWSLATKAIAEVFDLYWAKGCLESAVAPDGHTVACVDGDGHLTVIDALTGRQVFQKKSFYQATFFDIFVRTVSALTNARISGGLSVEFSSSGQYLAAGYTGYQTSGVLVYDVVQKTALPLKDPAKRLLGGTFAFVGGDRLIGLNPRDPNKSGVVQLPGGNVEELPLPEGALSASGQPKYVLVRPAGTQPIGVFDMQQKALKSGFDTVAVDVFDDQYVTDTGIGEVGLYALEGKRVMARVALETPPITAVRTAAISPDFRWLALSGATRAAVWDTTRQLPVAYMREFDGSFMDESGKMFGYFPRSGGQPRAIMQFDGLSRRVSTVSPVVADGAMQYGQWFFLGRRLSNNPYEQSGAEYQLRDVRKAEVLWTRKFERDPPDDYWLDPQTDAVALVWLAESPGGRTLVARDERLKRTVDRGDVKGDFVLEILDAPTGDVRGRMLVETGRGSFHLHGVLVRGDLVFVTDSLGRILTYSLSTGELKGYAFGDTPVVAANGSAIAVGTGEGRLVIYDVATMARRSELRFKRPVVFSAFSPNGSQLFVLTADQTAHVIGMK